MELLKEDFEKEQAKLHWQYEKKKFSLYEKRKKPIADIPRFWATAVIFFFFHDFIYSLFFIFDFIFY